MLLHRVRSEAYVKDTRLVKAVRGPCIPPFIIHRTIMLGKPPSRADGWTLTHIPTGRALTTHQRFRYACGLAVELAKDEFWLNLPESALYVKELKGGRYETGWLDKTVGREAADRYHTACWAVTRSLAEAKGRTAHPHPSAAE